MNERNEVDDDVTLASLATPQNPSIRNPYTVAIQTDRRRYAAAAASATEQQHASASAASETAAAAIRAVSSARTAGETDNANTNNPALQEAINKLSRSAATQRGRDSAMKVFHKYMEESNTDLVRDLQRAEDTEAKGEIALSFILDLATWLKRNPVQAQGKKKALQENTIGQYFGQIKENIKDVTSESEIWNNHEDVWYTKLLKSVKKAYSFNILEGEAAHRDPTCRAIPLKCSPGKLLQRHREWLDETGADLDSIIKQILESEFNNIDCHEERFMLLLTFLTVGRGGELKFLRHDNNIWDYHANCLQGIQTRLKTRTQQPFWVQCAPFGNYRVDFLHAFAAWASVGDALFRADPKEAGSIFWFPTMRKFRNEKIAGQITKIIKKYVATCMQSSSSSRSLRVGANTDLAINKDIANEEQRQASGHSGGTTTELYVRMNPDLGVPASLALSMWENIRGKLVSPPTLDAIDLSNDEIDLLLDNLYDISLDMYKKDRSMRVLLRHATASMIMYHPTYVNDYGIHSNLPQALIRAVTISLDLEDNDVSSISIKINGWSESIKTFFVTENNLLSPSATDTTVLQTVNNQSVMINQLIIDNENYKRMEETKTRTMQLKLERCWQKVEAIQNQNNTIIEQNSTIIELLQNMGPDRTFTDHSSELRMNSTSRRDVAATTPTRARRRPRRQRIPAAAAAAAPVTMTTTMAETAVVSPSASRQAAVVVQSPLAPSPLAPSPTTVLADPWETFSLQLQSYIPKSVTPAVLNWKDVEGNNTSTRGRRIRIVLQKMFNHNQLQHIRNFVDVHNSRPTWIDSNDGGHFKRMLIMVDYVVSDVEKKMLTSSVKERQQITTGGGEKTIKYMLENIETKVFAAMLVLDGKKSNQTRKTMTGIGGRLLKILKNRSLEQIGKELKASDSSWNKKVTRIS